MPRAKSLHSRMNVLETTPLRNPTGKWMLTCVPFYGLVLMPVVGGCLLLEELLLLCFGGRIKRDWEVLLHLIVWLPELPRQNMILENEKWCQFSQHTLAYRKLNLIKMGYVLTCVVEFVLAKMCYGVFWSWHASIFSMFTWYLTVAPQP